jgi:hypothetical protein
VTGSLLQAGSQRGEGMEESGHVGGTRLWKSLASNDNARPPDRRKEGGALDDPAKDIPAGSAYR